MDISQPDDAQSPTPDIDDRPEASVEESTSPDPTSPDDAARPQRFADVLDEVDNVSERPLDEHNDVFSRAHRELTDALNDVDRGDS